MPGFNKLNTVPRNSGSRIFGSGDTFIINPSGAAGIGSTALVDENTTFYFSGKRNLRDKMNGRFVLSATGGTGGTHNGGGGGGGAYMCGTFDDFPGHGWCINGCKACNCTCTCFCASPTFHFSLTGGNAANNGNTNTTYGSHGGGSGGNAGPTACVDCNASPIFKNLCVKGGGAGGNGGTFYNPQPRPGGNGGTEGCSAMTQSTCHRLGSANPYYKLPGKGGGGAGRPGTGWGAPTGNTGGPGACGGMIYIESPGRADNQCAGYNVP